MTRRGKRGTDGPPGRQPWPAGEYERRSRQAGAAADYDPAADYGPPAWEGTPPGTPGPGAPGTSGTPRNPWDQTGPPWDQAGPPWEETGPPWEVPGWDEPDAALPRGHPSGPLSPVWPDSPGSSSGPLPPVSSSGPQPAVSSGPLPPVPGEPLAPLPHSERDWLESPAGGYQGDSMPGPPDPGYSRDPYSSGESGYPVGGGDSGYPAADRESGYQSRHGQDRYGPAGYAGAGYPGPGLDPAGPDSGEHAGGGYSEGGPGYPDTGYPDRDYGFPGDAPGYHGYAGGQDYPSPAGYRGYGGDQDYPDPAGYPGGAGYADGAGFGGEPGYPGGGDYLDAQGSYPGATRTGRPGDEGPGGGYASPGGWYGDVDDEQASVDEDYGEAFLPGLRTGTREGRDGGPPSYRAGSRSAGARRGGRGPGMGGKRRRGMRRAAPWIALTVVFLVLGVAGGGALYVYRHYLHPPDYAGPGYGSVEVQIYKGDTATAVGQRLFTDGVVASARAFANAAKASGHGTALEPGLYRLRKHMSAALAFSLLVSQKTRVQTRVVIPEGLRLSDIIHILGKQTGNPKGYEQAITETAKLGLPPYAHGNPQGYLFPATYNIQPGTPPLTVLRQMVAAFDREAASVSLPAAAAKGFMTPGEVITVASLIEAEGGRISDYPKIAGVIYNRLNRNMPLQLDSTVLFGLHKYGFLATAAELRINTPYNTYLHKGLPPGPIDSPGDAAIRAALHPVHNPWLYFVTVNPKTRLTKFTSSYPQFLQYKAQLNAYLAKHP